MSRRRPYVGPGQMGKSARRTRKESYGISGSTARLGFEVINKGRCGYPGCKRSALLFCDEHAAEIRAVSKRKKP